MRLLFPPAVDDILSCCCCQPIICAVKMDSGFCEDNLALERKVSVGPNTHIFYHRGSLSPTVSLPGIFRSRMDFLARFCKRGPSFAPRTKFSQSLTPPAEPHARTKFSQSLTPPAEPRTQNGKLHFRPAKGRTPHPGRKSSPGGRRCGGGLT